MRSKARATYIFGTARAVLEIELFGDGSVFSPANQRRLQALSRRQAKRVLRAVARHGCEVRLRTIMTPNVPCYQRRFLIADWK